MYTRSLSNGRGGASARKGAGGSGSRGPAGAAGSGSVALWSAVALQQHMVLNSGLQGILPMSSPSGHASAMPLAPQPRSLKQQQQQQQQQQASALSRNNAGQQQQHQQQQQLVDYNPPPRLSLAQKMGLVEAPPPPPTEPQWESCLLKAATRNDARQPCSICCEPFLATASHAQVILDCSHVFHQTCIQQLEKFARRAGHQPTCPICRRVSYHKRLHGEGKAQVQHLAATRIQCLVRRMLAKKRVLKLRLQQDPKFRCDYAYEQLRGISDGYMAYAVSREKEVDTFLEEIDMGRQIAAADMMTPKEWDAIRNQVLSRHESLECPICMGAIGCASSGGSGGGASAVQAGVMLSCSHCFHAPCFTAFENIALAKPGAVAKCPVCRSGYRKRPLVD